MSPRRKSLAIVIGCLVCVRPTFGDDAPKKLASLPERFQTTARATAKQADSIEKPADKQTAVFEAAEALRLAGNPLEARKSLDHAIALIDSLQGPPPRANACLNAGRALVDAGDKAAAARMFIRAIVETKKAFDDQQVEADVWACSSFGKIAVEQAKLSERDHAAETLELAAQAQERTKVSKYGLMSFIDLFDAQFDAGFGSESLQTLDRVWEGAKTKLDVLLPLLKTLEDKMRSGDDRRNAPLLDWMRRRVDDSESARKASKNEPGAEKNDRGRQLAVNLQNKRILQTLARMQARAGDFDAALKTAAEFEKTGMVGAASDGVELRASIATERFAAGDKDGARATLNEARLLAEESKTRAIPPAWARLARAQAKTGDIAGATKSIAKIAVAERPENDRFRQQLAMNIRVEKSLALAELARAQGLAGDKPAANASLAAALALAKPVPMENFQHDQPLAEIAAVQARLGAIDSLIDTLKMMSGTKIGDTVDSILASLVELGDHASLERLAELIASNDAIEQAAKKFKARADSSQKKNQPDRPPGIPPGLMAEAASLMRMLAFSTSLGKERLEARIAVAEGVSGNLDSACARIERLSNPARRASALLSLAKALTKNAGAKSRR